MEQEQISNKNVYFIIIAVIIVIVAILLGFKGYQWYRVDFYKNLLKKELNRKYELRKRGSFCYKVGKVTFPYVDEGYPDDFISKAKQLDSGAVYINDIPNYRKDENSYKLNLLLPIFYDAGLLSRELEEGTTYYQYDITGEGKKYQAKYDDTLVFCYGKKKVLEVTDITKQDSFTYKGKTDVTVIYNYELDEVPNWLMNEDFIRIYGPTKGKNRIGREVFIEKNGNIFIDGDFDSHIYEPFYEVE